jgi:hypothetical protein
MLCFETAQERSRLTNLRTSLDAVSVLVHSCEAIT